MYKIFLIIQREFRERVAKKSFIIVTILMPLLMLLLSCLPALIMTFVDHETKTIVVIDDTNAIASELKDSENIHFITGTAPLDSALKMADVDGILMIPSTAIENAGAISYYSNGPSSVTMESQLADQLSDIIEQRRIESYDIDNLKEIMEKVHVNVSLNTFRNDADSSQLDSAGLSFAMGMGLSLILYMFLLLYGQMVMTSIIEEKNNRVLDLVVTSVKPMHLMLGKIFGIASVAVVQVLIWMVLMCCITAFVLPAVLPGGMMEEIAAAQSGNFIAENSTYDADLITVLSTLGSVSYILNMLFMMLLFLVGGFLLYSAIFAAVGSAVDNIQDASQLQTIVIVPIILGLVLAVTVANDPQSMLGVVCSYIPFTAPMVMMARIPFGVPTGEVVLSLLILFASFVACAWIAGKVYRVGIFMHGTKPSFKDLYRWIKQS